MLTRILAASALVALAGTSAHAQQHSGNAGVFHWTSADDDAKPARTSTTVTKTDDTVLVYATSAKGGMRVSFSDGEKVIELRVDSDTIYDLDVTVDDKPLTGCRAEVDDEQIVVYGPKGAKLAEINLPDRDEDEAAPRVRWSAQAAPSANGGQLRATTPSRATGATRARGMASVNAANELAAAQPRRVIGISASTPSEALAAQLGIDADKVTVIESVNEGLPAEMAGLKRFDIITKIEGAPPADLGRLRSVIESKGTNDTIALTILRNGQEKQIVLRPVDLETQAFEVHLDKDDDGDDDDDNTFTFQGFGSAGNRMMQNLSPEQRAEVERAMANVHHALEAQQERLKELQENLVRQMHDLGGQIKDSGAMDEVRAALMEANREIREVNVKEQVERAMEEVRRAMSAMDSQNTMRTLPRIRFLDQDDQGVANGRGVVVAPVAPAPPPPPQAFPGRLSPSNDDGRLQALEERMARIEQLLERIADDRDR